MKFGDMAQGTHFESDGRKFIKLQNTVPSGRSKIYYFKIDDFQDSFNAIDYNGITAKCPEWCEFLVIEHP